VQIAMAIVLFLMIFGISIRVFFLWLSVLETIRQLCKGKANEPEDADELQWIEGAEVETAFAPGRKMKHFIHGIGYAISFDESRPEYGPEYVVSFCNGWTVK
jgi:hypothetical protein